MGAYITIIMANDSRCAINYGLQQVLCYIGSDTTRFDALKNDRTIFEKGIDIIDRRLKKRHKTSIRRLVYCKRVRNKNKFAWKLHRTRTVKILQTIWLELKKKKAPDEVYSLFQEIYVYLYNLLCGDIQRKESDILSRAYIRGIYYAAGPLSTYSQDEKNHLNRIVDALRAYDKSVFGGE